jgi:hypothetical protein
VVEKAHEQLPLALEVAVERALAEPRLGADVIDGQLGEAVLGGAAPSGLDQLLATLVTDLGAQLGQGRLLIFIKPTGRFLY